MSWVALGTAAVGAVGSVAAGSGGGGGGGTAAAPALPSNFYGGSTGDFLVGSSKGKKAGDVASGGATVAGGINQTTIWVIVAAVVGLFLVWRVTAKK